MHGMAPLNEWDSNLLFGVEKRTDDVVGGLNDVKVALHVSFVRGGQERDV